MRVSKWSREDPGATVISSILPTAVSDSGHHGFGTIGPARWAVLCVLEGFSSDEELSLYDLLFSENLSKQDIQRIKQVAVDLLAKVKTKIAELDHWTDKPETKAVVDNLIRNTLWTQLPSCYDDISQYRQRIYEYVYTRYPDVA